MTLRTMRRTIPLVLLLPWAAGLLAPTATAQEDAQRCEGTVTDPEGNPLAGAEITFLDKGTNRYAQPVKTSKKGKWAHSVLRANTEPGWEIRATLEGYRILKITALSQNSLGEKRTDENYMVGFNQEGLHTVSVPAQARGDAQSRGKCVVDFILAPEASFNEIYHKMKGAETAGGAATAGGAVAPGVETPDILAVPGAPAPAGRSSLETAQALIGKGDFASAVEPARKAVEAEPDSAEASFRLGQALLRSDKAAEAEAPLKKAFATDATTRGLASELGLLYIKLDRPMQAIPYFEKANEASPDDPAILQNLAKLYADTDQNDKAIAVLEQLVTLAPDRVEFYGSLAAVYKKSGNAAKERETYERMGAADSSGMAFYNLGNLMFNKSEMTAAAAAYEKAVAQAPDNAMAHYQLGLTYVNLARFKDATRELETFLKLDPKNRLAADAKSTLDLVKGM